jgi:hypothetical protein
MVRVITSRGISSSVQSSKASTLIGLRPPSKTGTSLNDMPFSKTVRINSRPVGDNLNNLTLPSIRLNRPSQGSPSTKMVSPALYFWITTPRCNSARTAGAKPAQKRQFCR